MGIKRFRLIFVLLILFVHVIHGQSNNAKIVINGNKNKYELKQSSEDSINKDSVNFIDLNAKGDSNILKLEQSHLKATDSVGIKVKEPSKVWAFLSNTNVILGILACLIAIGTFLISNFKHKKV